MGNARAQNHCWVMIPLTYLVTGKWRAMMFRAEREVSRGVGRVAASQNAGHPA